jgi:hypothetical protein
MARKYEPVKPRTIDDVLDEKMQVLRELCVVTKENSADIRYLLLSEIRKYPDTDMDIVVDRVAKSLIANKFY